MFISWHSGYENNELNVESAEHLCKMIVEWAELACLEQDLDEILKQVLQKSQFCIENVYRKESKDI